MSEERLPSAELSVPVKLRPAAKPPWAGLWELVAARRERSEASEREEFPALLEQVSQPRRRMLGLEVRLTQALAPTRPHRLVNNELTNKLATPVFGPLDRGRDLLRRASART